MNWSDWIYLVVGIGIGVGSHWLLRKLKEPVVASDPFQMSPSATTEAANQELSNLLQQLQQTQMAYHLASEMSLFKAGFLARVAHELRSPLNSIIGLHQLILENLCDNPGEEREFVAQANSSALKLIHLIDEILVVARLEHGNNQLEIQPLQLADVLAKAYNVTHLIAADRNIRFHFSPPDPEFYVLADPRWLQQVLVNLVGNCLAQMQEGSISVSAQSTPLNQLAQIWLDVQLPFTIWSEPVDLIQAANPDQEKLAEDFALSPGLTLLLNQTLLALMHGRLELISLETDAAETTYTRIQLTIPVVIPETVPLEPEEK